MALSAVLFKYKNSKKWWIRIHRAGSGRGQKEFIPTHTADEDEANVILDKIKGDRAHGKPLPAKQAHTKKFAELVVELLDRWEKRKKPMKTFKHEKGRFINHIVPFFETVLAVDVTDEMIEQYKSKRECDPENPALKTIDEELRLIRAVFKLARKLYRIPGPDITRYTKAEKSNPRQGFFEIDEFDGVLALLPDVDRQDYFCTLGVTGWRYGEVANIRRRHISWAEDAIRLDPGSQNSKTGEARVFPLTDRLREIFERRLAQPGFANDHVFTYQLTYKDGKPRGKRRPIGDMRAVWATACYRAGVPCVTEPWKYREPKSGKVFTGVRVLKCSKTPHDLRRSAVRNFSIAEVPDPVAMKLTGHRTRWVYDQYRIVPPAELKIARNQINAAYKSAKIAAPGGRAVVESDRKSKA